MPSLAFVVLFVIMLGQFGEDIPAKYTRLVYAIGLGVPFYGRLWNWRA